MKVSTMIASALFGGFLAYLAPITEPVEQKVAQLEIASSKAIVISTSQ